MSSIVYGESASDFVRRSRIVVRENPDEIDPAMPSFTLADGRVIQIPIEAVHEDAQHWDELYPSPLGTHGLEQHSDAKHPYSVEQWEHDREIEAFLREAEKE